MRSFGFPFSSDGGWWCSTLMRTPSASGFSRSLPTILTSKEKLILEQFLKGIFMIPLLGILMIFAPVALSSSSLRHTICGTSPLLCTGTTRGASSSICSSRTPLISVETSNSGMLARMKMFKGSPSLMGSSISATSSPFSTAFTVKILSKLNFSLLGKGWTFVLILIMWNSRLCPSSKQSMSSARRVSCLKEEAKMGYLQKLILLLSILRHSLVWKTVKVFLLAATFSFALSFIKILSFKSRIASLQNCRLDS